MTTGQKTKLRRPRKETEERLRKQIFEGQLLDVKSVVAPDQFRFEARAWLDYNIQLLPDLFTTDEILRGYIGPVIVKTDFDLFSDQHQREIDDLKDEIRDKLPRLNSILKRLEFFEEESSHPVSTHPIRAEFNIETTKEVPPQKSDYKIDSERLHSAKDPLADEWIRKLKNNRPVAALVVIAVVVVAFATFTESITKIRSFFFGNNTNENSSISSSLPHQPTTQQALSHSENDPLPLKATPSGEKARASLREQHKVRPLEITESNLTLSEVSRGIYGFAIPGILAGEIILGKRRVPLSRQRHELHDFEVHKLINGEEHVIGFVESETASQLRLDIRPKDLRFSLYADQWPDAQVITSLPLSKVDIERFPPRKIELDKSRSLATLDIHLKR